MIRTKTNRILWTIAVLIALSLVAGIVLHKHDESKIIGKLSKEDISQVSAITLKYECAYMKDNLRNDWADLDLKALGRDLKEYYSIKVVTIDASDSRIVWVGLGIGTNETMPRYFVGRCPEGWKLETLPREALAARSNLSYTASGNPR